jgi:hypothetical protein
MRSYRVILMMNVIIDLLFARILDVPKYCRFMNSKDTELIVVSSRYNVLTVILKLKS